MRLKWTRSMLLIVLIVALSSCASKKGFDSSVGFPPKYEFRGAWIQTVYQSEYANLSTDAVKQLLQKRVEALHRAGCNAVIFQVRPEGDAFYQSGYEPWSRFLTKTQGKAPSPYWDPLNYMIELCHERGMELHAWINPYRAAANQSVPMSSSHPAVQHPDWCVSYNNQLFYNPGIPACREHICKVVTDIVLRYDIDALHMDDYFYPYPVAGLRFQDDDTFRRYGRGFSNISDWRRDNVNRLIADVKQTIAHTKPWVKFGVSPFGIYRNKRSSAIGSNTGGLQNYDDLFADVLQWEASNNIDYIAPQLYWAIGHKVADFSELAHWWNRHTYPNTDLYFGIDVKRTMNEKQLRQKVEMTRKLAKGIIYWPANEVVNNTGGIADSLRTIYQSTIALIEPSSKFRHKVPKVKGLTADRVASGYRLSWLNTSEPCDPITPQFYVVYLIPKGHKVTTDYSQYIIYVGPKSQLILPYSLGKGKYTCLVTALDRFKNESKPQKIVITL